MRPARSLYAIALAAALVAGANTYADDDDAAALLNMRRASVTPQIVTEFCVRQYPEYAGALRASFDAWRRKHADLIFEIETRSDRLMRQETPGDDEAYANLTAKEQAAAQRYRAIYEAGLRHTPETESKPACAKYGAYLTTGGANVADLEKMFAPQLKLIRDKDDSRTRYR